MALSSTDPKVLMGAAKCFSCLTPKQQFVLQTYLLTLIGMGDTSAAGVRAISSGSTCYNCFTHGELVAMKQYLLALWLGLDTSQAGIQALAKTAACDYACLTPKQQQQVETYLLSITAGSGTDRAGVILAEAAARCFGCLETKQQLMAQVYLLSLIVPGAPSTPAAIMAAAKCFLTCVPPELHEAFNASLITQAAGRSTPPCVTPSSPISVQVSSARVADPTTQLSVRWLQSTNSGTLITGYTVFWGTTSGGPYTNNSGVLAAGTKLYTITGLTAGTTYFVVVQADTAISGCVSANSAETSGTTSGSAPIDPAVTAWQARVIANGGASPGAATLAAADTFWKSMKAAGIDTLIKELNFFAPDSVIAALTPFIVTREANLWTAATASITNNGLSCGVTTVVDTAGSGPNYFTTGNCGMSWYGRSVANKPDHIQCGTGTGGNDSIFLYPLYGASYSWPATHVSTGASPFNVDDYGMLSLNRIATNDLRVFWGNNAIPMVQTGATVASASGPVPIAPSWNVGTQAGLGGRFAYNFSFTYIHSMFAVHLGMTLAQATSFQAAVGALRVAFGGLA